HRRRHADDADRDDNRGREARECRDVRGDPPEREQSKEYDEWQGGGDRRERPVQRIVVLLPGHAFRGMRGYTSRYDLAVAYAGPFVRGRDDYVCRSAPWLYGRGCRSNAGRPTQGGRVGEDVTEGVTQVVVREIKGGSAGLACRRS